LALQARAVLAEVALYNRPSAKVRRFIKSKTSLVRDKTSRVRARTVRLLRGK